MPKITVAIPVYNVEKYLRQCLDSVVNQTLKDLQIICVDDGSTDGSLAIVQEYAERDKRIEVYSKPNEGLGITRNFVYPLIKGKYTYFMDSDDWLELDGLEHVYQLAEKYNADVVCLNYYKNDRDRSFPFQNQTCWVSPDKKKRMWALQFAFPFAWAKLYNTDFLTKNQIFFSEALRSQDHIVHWKTFLLGNAFCFCPLPIYHYRIVKNSSENTIRFNHRCLSVISAMQEIENYLKESGLYEEYVSFFSSLKFHNIWYYYKRTDKDTKQEFKKRFDVFTQRDWKELLKLHHPISLKGYCFFIAQKYKFPVFLWIYGFIKRTYDKITGKYPGNNIADLNLRREDFGRA